VTRLVDAELLKLGTTRLLLWLGLMTLGLITLIVSVNGAERSVEDLTQPNNQRDLITVAAIAALVTLILGIVASTAEYAHGTIGHTFLVTPVRERVVGAKLVAAVLTGAALAAAACAVTVGLVALWLAVRSIPSHLESRRTLELIGGVVLAAALTAAIGVGFGALVRRQTAAIVVSLVWLLIGEPLLALTHWQRYAPGHVIVAVAEAGQQGPDLLRFWPGLLLAVGYATLFVVAGTLMVTRSDVT
jgi:ABC-2 type transport system permease protein